MNLDQILKKYMNMSGSNSNESFLSSFVTCFSNILGSTQDELFDVLESKKSSNICQRMLKLEFGDHARFIDFKNMFCNKDGCYPVLSMLAIISNTYKRKIFLLCDHNNLASFHKYSKLLCIQPVEECDQNSIFLSLMNYFVLNEIHFDDESEKLAVANCKKLKTIQLSKYNSENGDNCKNITYKQRRSHKSASRIANNNNFTIEDFIKRYTRESENESIVIPEAYSNDSRINFKLSDVRIQKNIKIGFTKTLDIDGFFSIVKPIELYQSINSGGKIMQFVSSGNQILKKSISKIMGDTFDTYGKDISVVKLAELESKHRMDIYAFTVNTAENFDLVKVLSDAYAYANSFPCISEKSCKYATEQRSLRCSRPLDPSQIKVRTLVNEYEANSFQCLLRHFSQYLVDEFRKYSDMKLYFFIRSIGSKFKLISKDKKNLPKLIDSLMEPLNKKFFYSEKGPKAFIDIAFKFIPDCPEGKDKVNLEFSV